MKCSILRLHFGMHIIRIWIICEAFGDILSSYFRYKTEIWHMSIILIRIWIQGCFFSMRTKRLHVSLTEVDNSRYCWNYFCFILFKYLCRYGIKVTCCGARWWYHWANFRFWRKFNSLIHNQIFLYPQWTQSFHS